MKVALSEEQNDKLMERVGHVATLHAKSEPMTDDQGCKVPTGAADIEPGASFNVSQDGIPFCCI